MQTPPRPTLSIGTRLFLGLAVVISAVNAVDFLFYGRELRMLLAAVGFALMAYAAWCNGVRPGRRGARASVPPELTARYANIVGIVLVLASFALRLLQ